MGLWGCDTVTQRGLGDSVVPDSWNLVGILVKLAHIVTQTDLSDSVDQNSSISRENLLKSSDIVTQTDLNDSVDRNLSIPLKIPLKTHEQSQPKKRPDHLKIKMAKPLQSIPRELNIKIRRAGRIRLGKCK